MERDGFETHLGASVEEVMADWIVGRRGTEESE